MAEIRETVILGSGCAGLTAALYTARAGLKPLVLEGHEPGGQLSITTLVENFPGWPEGIQGPELIGNIKKQAARFGAEYQHAHLEGVESGAHPIKLRTSAGELHARTLIVASGASARWLGLPSEQALIGHGVSSCATCDGFFFRDKDIAVIGGGDSAMEEAIFLTRFASKVTLLHRRDAFRASKIMLERAMAHPKIELRTNTIVDEVLGVDEKEVKGLRLRDVKSGEQDELNVSGMFLGIGHVPNTNRHVPDAQEHPADVQLVLFAPLFTSRKRSPFTSFSSTPNFIHNRVRPQFEFGMRHGALQHNLRGSESVATVQERHLRSKARKKNRFYAPADHCNVHLSRKKKPSQVAQLDTP